VYDWVYHNFGVQHLGLDSQPWTGFGMHDGYQHLTGNRVSNSPSEWQDLFQIKEGDDSGSKSQERGMHLWMLGDTASSNDLPSTQVIQGSGLGPDLQQPVPYVMARRKAQATAFVTLLEPFENAPVIQKFERQSDGSYLVQGTGWRDIITVGAKVQIQH
jgi:hypothetical protein